MLGTAYLSDIGQQWAGLKEVDFRTIGISWDPYQSINHNQAPSSFPHLRAVSFAIRNFFNSYNYSLNTKRCPK